MARSDAEWVQDILSAIADIRADTDRLDFPAFAAKPTIERSVLDSIAVIGEAAKNIGPAFKTAYRIFPGARSRVSAIESFMSISVPTRGVFGTLWKAISTTCKKR